VWYLPRCCWRVGVDFTKTEEGLFEIGEGCWSAMVRQQHGMQSVRGVEQGIPGGMMAAVVLKWRRYKGNRLVMYEYAILW
jgi:hypothetical protein